MLRLRTTTGLSIVVLAIGVAGTGWLSTLTTGWHGPVARLAAHRPVPVAARATPRRHAGAAHVVRADAARAEQDDGVRTAVPPPRLVPLAMPGDSSLPWYELRGHLDGHVVVQVDTDGHGRVDRASLVESSGDPILDAHALRSVQGWRFAVPSDQPAGVSGELPMRFSSHEDTIARVP